MPGFASFIVSNLALDIQPLFLEAFFPFVFTASVLTVDQFISWSFLLFYPCSLHLPISVGCLSLLLSYSWNLISFLKVLPKDLKLILSCRFWNLSTENEIILVLPLASPIPTTVSLSVTEANQVDPKHIVLLSLHVLTYSIPLV